MTRTPAHIALLFIISLIVSACGSLAGEPEIVATLTPSQPDISTSANHPAAAPDMINGARIFAENCTSCHGENGDGQGELVQSGEVPAMPSFLDAAHVTQQLPGDYYDIITDGRIENLMPPWADELSAQERWDVALYVYTLHYDETQLALGADVYAAECASCHGDTGLGDGPEMQEADRSVGDLQDQTVMPFISDQAIFVSVDEGIGDAMPALGDELSDDEMRAAVAHTRTLSTRNLIASRSPQSIAQAADTVTVTGTVQNDTTDATVAPQQVVELRYGNPADGIEVLQTTIDDDGAFTFDEVPVNEDYEYVTVVFAGNQIFVGDVLTGDQLQPVTEMPVTIYEVTEDPSNIRITHIDATLEPFRVEDVGTGLLITEQITYTNDSDRLYTTSQAVGNNVYATLLIELPPGSIVLSARTNPRFIIVDEQYAVIDTQPLPPGDSVVEISYFVPYDNGAVIDRPLHNQFDGTVEMSVISPRLRINSDTLSPVEGETPDEGEGVIYRGEPALDEQNIWRYEVTGRLLAGENTSRDPSLITGDTLLPVIGVAALIIALIAGGVLLSRRSDSLDKQIDALVRRIAELDQLHEQGHINHDVYRRQSAALRQELDALLAGKTDEPSGDES